MATAAAKTESYVDNNKRKDDVRQANIVAARTVADAVRTSLGPKGMDKMISTAPGEVIITKDGATILNNNKMEVLQPAAAKMLVELSKSQDIVAGDGTTTVVVIAGAFLKQCLLLLNNGIHPTVISESLHKVAVTDLSLHYLSKSKILAIKDVERDEIEFITKTLNCLPIANIDHFREEKLGRADCVDEISLGDEAERSLHDASCVIRCLVTKRFVIAGGGAIFFH